MSHATQTVPARPDRAAEQKPRPKGSRKKPCRTNKRGCGETKPFQLCKAGGLCLACRPKGAVTVVYIDASKLQ